MSEATQTQTLEQTLNKTDLGHVIYENRKIFFSVIIAIFIGAGGFVLWKQNRQSEALKNSVSVFNFQSKTWSEAKAGKLPVADLLKSFESLEKDVQSSPLMIPVGLEMAKFLFGKNNFAEADTILSKLNTDHQVAAFFVNLQRSVILEKMSKTDEAITLLEKLAQQKEGLMPARVNLELGRLNLLKGEKGKAQTHFDFVINNYPNDEHAKLAKLYLSQMAQ
jgi:predicted negative regulator of RcsB-dependent stress response